MGFVGNLFGSSQGNTGGAGMNYQATGASASQLDTAYQQQQMALAQQQAFANALAQQQAGAIGNQQMLGNLLAQQAQGAGPNPAQEQYKQNISNLAAQQAGAIASQKGLSPALQARLIAQQAGQAGQNAAGQAATMQAQQQLAAQNNLAGLTGQQLGQQQAANTSFGQQALQGQGNLLGLEQSANSANAGVAGGVAGAQGKMFGGLMNAAGAGFANGGEVPDSTGPISFFGKHIKMMKEGGIVPGKAEKAGDSKANDTVPAMLSPKEIVLPRSVTMAEDAPKKAAEFVAALKRAKK